MNMGQDALQAGGAAVEPMMSADDDLSDMAAIQEFMPPSPSPLSLPWCVRTDQRSANGSPLFRRRCLAERRGVQVLHSLSLERVSAADTDESCSEDLRADHISEIQCDMLFEAAAE